MTIFIITMGIFSYFSVNDAISYFRYKETDIYRNAYYDAAMAIVADNRNQPCAVWAITSYRPAVSWYTKCNTIQIQNPEYFDQQYKIYTNRNYYSIVLTRTSEEQITLQNAAKYGVDLKEIFRTNTLANEEKGDIIVYRLAKQDFDDTKDNDWINW
jgi:hypothetical protein